MPLPRAIAHLSHLQQPAHGGHVVHHRQPMRPLPSVRPQRLDQQRGAQAQGLEGGNGLVHGHVLRDVQLHGGLDADGAAVGVLLLREQ